MDGSVDMAALLSGETGRRDDRHWSIGELSREFDVTLRAMRFYEAKGLLKPGRTGQTRLYDAEDRRRLMFIVRAKRAGFSLVEIRELVELADGPEPTRARMTVLRHRLDRQIDHLEGVATDIAQALEAVRGEIATIDRHLAGSED